MFGLPSNVVLMALMISICVMAIAVAFLYPKLVSEKRTADRFKEVGAKRKTPKQRAGIDEAAKRRKNVQDSLKEIDEKNSGKKRSQMSLGVRLKQAGLKISKTTFFIFSAVSAVIFAVIGLFSSAPILVVAGLAFVGFLGFPRFVLNFLMARRVKRFTNELPEAIDVIVRGIKAGLPLNDCLRLVSIEAKEPVASEFKAIVETQQLGVPMSEAVQKLNETVPTPESNFFATVIAIQQTSGGSLSEALGNLSKILRDRKKMRAKVNAISSEAKSSAAIIGSLPILVGLAVGILNPTFIEPLFNTSTGHIIIGMGIGFMVTGVLVMRKMINFEI